MTGVLDEDIKNMGVIYTIEQEKPIFDELSFQVFEKKMKSGNIASFRKSKNTRL